MGGLRGSKQGGRREACGTAQREDPSGAARAVARRWAAVERYSVARSGPLTEQHAIGHQQVRCTECRCWPHPSLPPAPPSAARSPPGRLSGRRVLAREAPVAAYPKGHSQGAQQAKEAARLHDCDCHCDCDWQPGDSPWATRERPGDSGGSHETEQTSHRSGYATHHHATPPHATSHHTRHHATPHATPHITPRHTSHHATPHSTPRHTSHHATPHATPHITPRHTTRHTTHHTTPHHTSHHATPHATPHITPRHTSHHATPHITPHITPRHTTRHTTHHTTPHHTSHHAPRWPPLRAAATRRPWPSPPAAQETHAPRPHESQAAADPQADC
jgi:hypothetical protein